MERARNTAGNPLAHNRGVMPDTTHALADTHPLRSEMSAGAAVLAGAVLGGLGGFLFLTSRGTQVRQGVLDTTSRLLDGLDGALSGWAQLQRQGEAWRGADTVNLAAARAASRSAGGSER